MSEVLREELQRIGRVFFSYTRIVFGGMVLASLFFFLYAGVKAKYIPLEVLAAISSLVIAAIAFVCAFACLYMVRLRNREEAKHIEIARMKLQIRVIKGMTASHDEWDPALLRKRILDEVSALSPSQLQMLRKRSQLDEKIFRYTYASASFVGFVIATISTAFGDSKFGMFSRSRNEADVQKRTVG